MTTTLEPTPDAWADFWGFVPTGTEGCWEWTGTRNNTINRPIYARNSERHYAYRIAWILTNGPIPEGLGVLHRCDNPMCCRIDHLFLGTQVDNAHDMWAKGRGVKLTPRYGEEHHKVRCSDNFVRAARERYAAGDASISGLAREIGVCGRVLTSWLSGSTRLKAGGPINEHLSALAMAQKLRQAKRKVKAKPQQVAA